MLRELQGRTAVAYTKLDTAQAQSVVEVQIFDAANNPIGPVLVVPGLSKASHSLRQAHWIGTQKPFRT